MKATVFSLFLFSLPLFLVQAAEIGGIITPSEMLPQLKQLSGNKPMENPEIKVFIFMDAALPNAKALLQLVDNIYNQTADGKKKTEFYVVSSLMGEKNDFLGLSVYTVPFFCDSSKTNSVYREYMRTEIISPCSIVADAKKILWKGAVYDLQQVLKEIDADKFNSDDRLKLETMHGELQNAIQSSLPKVISETADRILMTYPNDMLSIQAKLFALESTSDQKKGFDFLSEKANALSDNMDVQQIFLEFMIRNDMYEEFMQKVPKVLDDVSKTPATALSLLSLVLERAPMTWIPLRQLKNTADSVKQFYAGKNNIHEFHALQFSAKVAYLLTDVQTAIAEQKKATDMLKGSEFEKTARQNLAFYQSVADLKAQKNDASKK